MSTQAQKRFAPKLKIKKGDTVVTSAQFLLDSEINMKAGLSRLDSSSPSSSPMKEEKSDKGMAP